MSLGHVAAPPVHVDGYSVGVGVLFECSHLGCNGYGKYIHELLYGCRVSLAGRGKQVTEKIGCQPAALGKYLRSLIIGILHCHGVIGMLLYILVAGLIAGHQVFLHIVIHLECGRHLAVTLGINPF